MTPQKEQTSNHSQQTKPEALDCSVKSQANNKRDITVDTHNPTAEEYLKDKRHLTNRNFPDINEWIVFEKDILKALELKEQEFSNKGMFRIGRWKDGKYMTDKEIDEVKLEQAKSQAKQELADDIDEIGGAEWQGQYVFDLQLKEWTEIKKRFNLK